MHAADDTKDPATKLRQRNQGFAKSEDHYWDYTQEQHAIMAELEQLVRTTYSCSEVFANWNKTTCNVKAFQAVGSQDPTPLNDFVSKHGFVKQPPKQDTIGMSFMWKIKKKDFLA